MNSKLALTDAAEMVREARAADDRVMRGYPVLSRKLERANPRTNDAGEWLCTRCKVFKPIAGFYLYSGKPDSHCRSCHNAYSREYNRFKRGPIQRRSQAVGTSRRCIRCETWKPFHQFRTLNIHTGRRSNECMQCDGRMA